MSVRKNFRWILRAKSLGKDGSTLNFMRGIPVNKRIVGHFKEHPPKEKAL
jgi:hypothetical protein